MPLNLSLLSSYSSPSPPQPRAFHVCVILTKPKKSSVTMQLFKLHDSGTELRVSISNNFCLREKAVGCPFTEHRMMWWARKEAPFIQRHSKGVGQRAKLCSSLTRWWKRLETCRQRSCCAVVFLCKLSFFFFSPSSVSVLQLVTDCHTFSSTLLSPTMSLLLLLLSSTAVISTHSQLSSLCSAKALPGNNIFAAAFTAFSWLLCVTPLPCVLLLQSVWMPLGEGPPGAVFSQSLSNMAPLLPNFILANILINVTKCSSTVMSSRRDWWNNCVAGMKQPGWWRSKASMSCASLT